MGGEKIKKQNVRRIAFVLTSIVLGNALFLLILLTCIFGRRIERTYKGSIRELDIRLEMKITKAPSKYIEGRNYYGVITLNKGQRTKEQKDTIIVGLWPDSSACLSLAINRENEEITIFDDSNPVLISANCFHFDRVDRDHYFTEQFFKLKKNELSGRYDIYTVNAQYIIINIDTHIRNYGFDVYSVPGKIAYAPWPWKNGFTEKELQKMITDYRDQYKDNRMTP